jgi:hypothetical protein
MNSWLNKKCLYLHANRDQKLLEQLRLKPIKKTHNEIKTYD